MLMELSKINLIQNVGAYLIHRLIIILICLFCLVAMLVILLPNLFNINGVRRLSCRPLLWLLASLLKKSLIWQKEKEKMLELEKRGDIQTGQ